VAIESPIQSPYYSLAYLCYRHVKISEEPLELDLFITHLEHRSEQVRLEQMKEILQIVSKVYEGVEAKGITDSLKVLGNISHFNHICDGTTVIIKKEPDL
jgi:hypothetical protein